MRSSALLDIRNIVSFTLTEMAESAEVLAPSDETVLIPLAQLEPEYFETKEPFESTRGLNKYFIPNYGNNPTFDAFIPTSVLVLDYR